MAVGSPSAEILTSIRFALAAPSSVAAASTTRARSGVASGELQLALLEEAYVEDVVEDHVHPRRRRQGAIHVREEGREGGRLELALQEVQAPLDAGEGCGGR